MLETIENLLQRELRRRQLLMVPSDDEISDRAADGERKRSNGESKDEGDARHGQAEAKPCRADQSRSAGNSAADKPCSSRRCEIRVESHDDTFFIHGEDRSRDLGGAHQVVSAAAGVHPAPDRGDDPALRLPGDSLREPSLHAKTFLPLHPRIYLGENRPLVSRDRSRRAREAAAGELCNEPALFGDMDTRPLFSQRLVENFGSQTDFLSDLEYLRFRDQIGGIRSGAASLQLGGAC